MEWSEILKEGLKVIAYASVWIGGTWLKKRIDKKKKESNASDLSTFDLDDLVNPTLQLIQERLSAFRVSYWEGRNGSYTLSGMTIRKLSIESEYNAAEADDCKMELQDVPIGSFKRNIDMLRLDPQDLIVSFENEYNDNLSSLHAAYGLRTIVACKVYVKRKWVGLLLIGFAQENKVINDWDKSWINTQAGRVGNIIESYIR